MTTIASSSTRISLLQSPTHLPQKQTRPPKHTSIWAQRLGIGCTIATLSLTFLTNPATASLTDTLSPDHAILDSARIIPTDKREAKDNKLLQLERETGWRIRVLTAFEGESTYSEDEIRDAWKLDKKTVVVGVDPSSPNIVAFRYLGSDVQAKLKRSFWVELQSRFGNMFFTRQEGEAAAVDGVLDAIDLCLRRPDGCAVVPGLSKDQFRATLVVSIAGGIVLGFSAKTAIDGTVSASWFQKLGWIAGFSPLWLILFVNLGLGPVLSRTDERWPVVANTAAFLLTALLLQLKEIPPKWMRVGMSSNDQNSDDSDNTHNP